MVPPASGHYRGPNNVSNPFNNYPGAHNSHAQQQQQHSSHYPGQAPFQPNSYSAGTANGGGGGAYGNGAHMNLFGGALPNTAALAGGFGGGAGLGGPVASQEAQMGFARGAAMQQQQQQQQHHQQQQAAQDMGLARPPTTMGTRIREVWKHNLQQEMAMIRSLVDRYPYVSMDTEFPGVVARPMGHFPTKADYHYQCLRCNVDLLKLIQLGITLFSVDGEVPPAHPESPSASARPYPNNLVQCPCTWTFNFDFSLEHDMYSQDSIDLLRKAGVDFDKTAEMGIDPLEFGSLLTTSGLVLNDDVSWLSFHSGYDFGYLVKVMAQRQLPNREDDYLAIVRVWFPRIYDIKFLFRQVQDRVRRGVAGQAAASFMQGLGAKSGLQDLADELGCQREGKPHTAGSDAWLTGMVFWALRHKLFDSSVPEELVGQIWGLNGVGPPASSASQHAAMAGHHTPATNGAKLHHETGMTPTSYHRDATPSTPQNSHSGLAATTPGTHGFSAMGGLTSGGVFSNFGQGYGR